MALVVAIRGRLRCAIRVLSAAGVVLVEHAECIGSATNNQAEYRALLIGLVACQSLTTGRVRCELDSQIVVNQLTGQFGTNNAELLVLRDGTRRSTRVRGGLVPSATALPS